MTRLSDALKRAAESPVAPADLRAASPAPVVEASPEPATDWQFAPVETMHVPVEPPFAPSELRVGNPAAPPEVRAVNLPLQDAVAPDALPETPKPSVVVAT